MKGCCGWLPRRHFAVAKITWYSCCFHSHFMTLKMSHGVTIKEFFFFLPWICWVYTSVIIFKLNVLSYIINWIYMGVHLFKHLMLLQVSCTTWLCLDLVIWQTEIVFLTFFPVEFLFFLLLTHSLAYYNFHIEKLEYEHDMIM